MYIKACCLSLFLLFSLCPGSSFGIGSDELARLGEAGIGSSVIHALEKEKILETSALSVDDIIALNKAGYSDKDISAYIYHRSFLKNATPRTYTNFDASSKIVEIDIEDLEYLKEIGFSDDVIKAVVFNQAAPDEGAKRREVLDMFENMGLLLDFGTNGNERRKPTKRR